MTPYPPTASARDRRYSQSLARGLEVLRCFTAEHPVRGIAEIADQVDLSRSTTHRYVTTLQALGYLEQDAARRYRLGVRVTDLGISAMSSLTPREHARPMLEELRDRTSYTTALATLDGGEILYLDRLRGSAPVSSPAERDLQPGSRLPAYCTAMGKLLLANLPANGHRAVLAPIALRKHGPNTIVSKKALQNELDQILAAGFAVNDEELARELIAIAAPVRNGARDVVAAISLSAHSSRVTTAALVDALLPHLITAADRISARLGYRRDDERYP